MTNKTYDLLKYVIQIVLPAVATLYVALASVWNLPYSEQVAGTITAIVTFGSTVLCITSANYQKGDVKNE